MNWLTLLEIVAIVVKRVFSASLYIRCASLAILVSLAGCSDEAGDMDSFEKLVAVARERPGSGVPTAAIPRPTATRTALENWQQNQSTRLAELFHAGLPKNHPVAISSRRELRAPRGLRRELIEFASADGTTMAAIAQYPVSKQSDAGILVIPGHVDTDDSGLRQLVYGHRTYQQAAATRLAQAGFTTLAFELRGFGLSGARVGTDHRHIAFNALLDGSFYQAVVVADARAALGVLAEMPHVAADRLGVTGASLGGEIALNVGALDRRIKAVAFSSYGGKIGPFPYARGPERRQRHYCHIVPGARRFMHQEDVLLLIAPRPVLGVRGQDDHSVDDRYAEIGTKVWQVLGAPGGFNFNVMPERSHEFFVEPTIAFFQRVFPQRDD